MKKFKFIIAISLSIFFGLFAIDITADSVGIDDLIFQAIVCLVVFIPSSIIPFLFLGAFMGLDEENEQTSLKN